MKLLPQRMPLFVQLRPAVYALIIVAAVYLAKDKTNIVISEPDFLSPVVVTNVPQWLLDPSVINTLGITPDQKDRLQAILGRAESKLFASRQQAVTALLTLRLSMRDPSASPSQLKQLARTATDAEHRLVTEQVEIWNEIRKVLTKEQLQNKRINTSPSALVPLHPDQPHLAPNFPPGALQHGWKVLPGTAPGGGFPGRSGFAPGLSLPGDSSPVLPPMPPPGVQPPPSMAPGQMSEPDTNTPGPPTSSSTGRRPSQAP